MENEIKQASDLFGRDIYKPGHEYKDFKNARYYPTKSTMDENHRYIGNHYSIANAHGLDDKEYLHALDKSYAPDEWGPFKTVGTLRDGKTSVFQGPGGYYSTNPLTTSLEFKTIEDLQDYADDPQGNYKKFGGYGNGYGDFDRVEAYLYANGEPLPPNHPDYKPSK